MSTATDPFNICELNIYFPFLKKGLGTILIVKSSLFTFTCIIMLYNI